MDFINAFDSQKISFYTVNYPKERGIHSQALKQIAALCL